MRIFAPFAMAALFGLTGCALLGAPPPAREPAPLAAPTQAALSLGEAPWPRDAWWSALADPQLDQLMARALADSPSLRAAEARLTRARALSDAARAQDNPSLGLGGDLTRQRYSAHGAVPPPLAGSLHNSGNLRLDAHYELDFWQRNGAALAAALSRERAAAAEGQQARLLLSTALTRAYIELAYAQSQSSLLGDYLAQAEATRALRARLQEAGLGSEVERAAADSRIAALQQRRQALAATQQRLRHQLAELAGQGPGFADTLVVPEWTGPGTVDLPRVLPADLLGRRPDLVAARWRVEAARGEERGARADFYPNVNLMAFVGLSAIGLNKLLEASSAVAGLGPAFSLPLFDGGRREARLAQTRAEEDLAVAEYEQTLLTALRQVADPVAELDSLGGQIRASDEAGRQAERAWSLVRQRRQAGLVSELAVLDAEIPWLDSRKTRLQLAEQQGLAQVDLIQALGGGYAAAQPQALAARSE